MLSSAIRVFLVFFILLEDKVPLGFALNRAWKTLEWPDLGAV